jgi:hypothetical protein
MRSFRPSAKQCGVLLVAGMLLGGCSQQRQFEPPVDPDRLSDIQFLHYLERVPVATYAEGCRAMLIAAGDTNVPASHAERHAELLRRDMVREAWSLKPDDVLDMGTMCFMAAKASGLRPSVSGLLLGSWGLGDRRYAVRECVYAGLIADAPVHQPVTGGALVWTMGRVDDYVSGAGAFAGRKTADSPATGDPAKTAARGAGLLD